MRSAPSRSRPSPRPSTRGGVPFVLVLAYCGLRPGKAAGLPAPPRRFGAVDDRDRAERAPGPVVERISRPIELGWSRCNPRCWSRYAPNREHVGPEPEVIVLTTPSRDASADFQLASQGGGRRRSAPAASSATPYVRRHTAASLHGQRGVRSRPPPPPSDTIPRSSSGPTRTSTRDLRAVADAMDEARGQPIHAHRAR